MLWKIIRETDKKGNRDRESHAESQLSQLLTKIYTESFIIRVLYLKVNKTL